MPSHRRRLRPFDTPPCDRRRKNNRIRPMPKPEIQILVCTNERPPEATKPCCGPRGMDVYRRFKDVVRKQGLRDRVMTVRTGCLKHCSQGITVCVWPENLWFRQVTVDDVESIVTRCCHGADEEGLADTVDGARIMPDIPWE